MELFPLVSIAKGVFLSAAANEIHSLDQPPPGSRDVEGCGQTQGEDEFAKFKFWRKLDIPPLLRRFVRRTCYRLKGLLFCRGLPPALNSCFLGPILPWKNRCAYFSAQA